MKNQVSTQQLVVWANAMKLPLVEIEQRSGLTRQGIWKRLKAAGCHVPRKAKGGAPGVWVQVCCAFCGGEVRRRYKLALRTRRQFCSENCYFAALENPGFYEWRHGSRLARAVVSQHFALESQHIVHHKDGNQRNNDRSNLMVFASQADHMRHHRGGIVKALWDGANA